MMNAKTCRVTETRTWRSMCWTASASLLLGLILVGPIAANTIGLTAGSGPGDPTLIPVPWGDDHYQVDHGLIFLPSAPPMIKEFESPPGIIFDPAPPGSTLIPTQTVPLPVWENWFLEVPSLPIDDWHEIILTPGWIWQFDPAGLITRNGDPIPSFPDPNSPPNELWVDFEPIFPGETLDIHKDLVWVGTPENPIWGDGFDVAGNMIDESVIQVREFPTPEPSSFLLAGIAAVGLVAYRWRRQRARFARNPLGGISEQ